MDPLGLLYAAIGMLVYPGGVYLTGLAGVSAWTAGLPRGPASIRAEAWAAIIAAVLAAVLAPMAGSLVAALPPDRGVAPNLVAAAMLLAAACALATHQHWSTRRLAAALGLGVPWLALAVGAASIQLPVIAGVPGTTLAAARWCTAAATLIAAPLVTQPFDAGVALGPRAVMLGALMLMALSIALAGSVTAGSAPLEALVVIAAGALYALLLRLLQRAVVVEHAALLVSCLACAGAATLLALLAARG